MRDEYFSASKINYSKQEDIKDDLNITVPENINFDKTTKTDV